MAIIVSLAALIKKINFLSEILTYKSNFYRFHNYLLLNCCCFNYLLRNYTQITTPPNIFC